MLIKSILGSLPIYYFSLFKAPQKVIELLESIRCRFFWGFKELQRGICWAKWNSILLNANMGVLVWVVFSLKILLFLVNGNGVSLQRRMLFGGRSLKIFMEMMVVLFRHHALVVILVHGVIS